ncbi:metallophosphoesterase family protein [Halorarum salinum]|uniref:Metallophosphoesterase family protein n=1 Tax=Halorarum salinum TaxID=2743089 RepID=A0A7D5L8U4_9EURY|nr:metallophosphoesterase family protein [Halobaculum salinum]QLG60913.1 metallophosphoesterase family protein [Halobaculum salinum]
MKLGVISDVHGNRVALDAVLADLPPVDGLVCAGDVVGYGPWPGECVAELRERGVPTVQGNHDRAAVVGSAPGFNAMGRAGVEYANRVLDADALDWLDGLPEATAVADGRVAVVHSHPTVRDRYVYPEEFGPDLLAAARAAVGGGADRGSAVAGDASEVDPEVLVLGHTHVQGHERFPEGVAMNPGSVGQPRDGDPRAAYAVLDLDGPSVEERRVEYDVDAVVDAVEAAGLPERIGTRLYEGR